MARMGRFDARQLKEFQKKLEEVQQNSDKILEECAKELAGQLLRMVKERTPVGNYSIEIEVVAKRNSKYHQKGDVYKKRKNIGGKTGGDLRRGWTIGEIKKEGTIYKIEIINPIEYGSYVEYGHRQTPGRYVPALGKRLKQGWVEGRFMMTTSKQDIETIAPSILEAKIKKYLEEGMK